MLGGNGEMEPHGLRLHAQEHGAFLLFTSMPAADFDAAWPPATSSRTRLPDNDHLRLL